MNISCRANSISCSHLSRSVLSALNPLTSSSVLIKEAAKETGKNGTLTMKISTALGPIWLTSVVANRSVRIGLYRKKTLPLFFSPPERLVFQKAWPIPTPMRWLPDESLRKWKFLTEIIIQHKSNSLLYFSEVVAKRITFSSEDATLSVLPFFHTTGFNGLLENFYIGIRMVLLPRYSLSNLLNSIQHFRVLQINFIQFFLKLIKRF